MNDNFLNLTLFKYIFRCVYRFLSSRSFRGGLMDRSIFTETGPSMRTGLVPHNPRSGKVGRTNAKILFSQIPLSYACFLLNTSSV